MKTPDVISTIMFRVLELSFVAGFFVLLIFICTKSIPAENKDLANILFGVLATIVAGIGNYEWGSSRGSDKKTEIMATADTQAKVDQQVKAQTSTESKVQTEPVKTT